MASLCSRKVIGRQFCPARIVHVEVIDDTMLPTAHSVHYLGERALSIRYESQGSVQCLSKNLPKS